MFGKIGLPELILILVIALIIFGPRKLPDIGRSIGKGIREFRQATTEISKTVSFDDDENVVDSDKKATETKETKESSDLKEDIGEKEQLDPESDDAQAEVEVDDETSVSAQDEEKILKTVSEEEAKH